MLIADDDDALSYYLRQNLEVRGFEVWEESQGDEALHAYLYNGVWDIVLTDFQFFPGVEIRTGLDLVRTILNVNPQQRIILHSTQPPRDCPCPTIRKPYGIEQLLRKLRMPIQPLLPLT
jgi:CheY-like chemotaxis protein